VQKTSKRTVSNRTRYWEIILMLLSATMLWMEGSGATVYAVQVTIDSRHSLVVTEVAILERFPFARVMEQLVDQSGMAELTPRQLFRQWWDTQNTGPGLDLGPHCDDTVDAGGNTILNDFPYACRPAPAEGVGTIPPRRVRCVRINSCSLTTHPSGPCANSSSSGPVTVASVVTWSSSRSPIKSIRSDRCTALIALIPKLQPPGALRDPG
jgi:hypothetical protein